MKRVTIAVLIDAFGWDVLETHPFLPELEHRKPLHTVLGFSSAALPSLLSGRRPDEHGRWFLYRRNPCETPFGFARLLAPFESVPQLGRRVRTAYERCFASFTEIRGYYHLYQVPLRLLPQFDLPERRPIFEPNALEGIPTLFDRIEERRIPYRAWFWRTPEERNFDELLSATRAGDVPFLFFYAFELDGTMHARGTRSPETGERIRRYEERLRAVLDEAGKRFDETAFLLFSDHGMVDVERTIDLMPRVRALPFREGKDYLPFYDSTFARFWFRSGEAERGIRALLEETEGGRLLSIEEEKRYAVHFPGREYGETIFVADAGTVIAPSFMGSAPPAAMHGYRPEERGSDGILLSNRPIPEGVRSIVDLASLVEAEAVRARGGVENGERR
jgi:hypothetical protein